MTPDLTVIYYTANFAHDSFVEAVRKNLLHAIGRFPLISVSQKPMDFGTNICVGDIGRSHLNIYRQILIGAKAAETPFVAMAEDDILYTPGHFTTHRPPEHKFAYNVNRWGIYTWSDPPCFSYKERMVVNQLIAPRQLLVDAMEERFAKYPDEDALAAVFGQDKALSFWGDPGRYEKALRVTVRERHAFASPEPNIVFSHEEAFGYESRGKRKSLGESPVTYLSPWGTAQELLEECWGVPQEV